MCLLCYYFRGVCESYSCFEEKVWTFVCSFFPAVKKYFFKDWDFFVVDSKLKPYLYEWILKVTCKFVCFFLADLIAKIHRENEW